MTDQADRLRVFKTELRAEVYRKGLHDLPDPVTTDQRTAIRQFVNWVLTSTEEVMRPPTTNQEARR